jgi:hypothetical protein
MAPFARDMGYTENPPRNGEVARSDGGGPNSGQSGAGGKLGPLRPVGAQLAGRLDALYFHLYGLGRDDAAYILSTFPIVARHDEAEHGRFLTRDLILAQMDALTAGDPDAMIVLR